MSDREPQGARGPSPGAIRAAVISVRCFLRALPLFWSASPKTPLRVLGIIAFDTLHVLRHGRPLPRTRVGELSLFLDFEGCANAACDHKRLCEAEYEAIRRQLDTAGLRFFAGDYLERLGELESRRPSVGGDHRRFDQVRVYRQAVAQLCVETAASMALDDMAPVKTARGAARQDGDVETLFRILMQCQIIDDVLDYSEDSAAGLPSFLTASASLPEALELTASAARSYAAGTRSSSIFPFRVALHVVSAMSRFIVDLARSVSWCRSGFLQLRPLLAQGGGRMQPRHPARRKPRREEADDHEDQGGCAEGDRIPRVHPE